MKLKKIAAMLMAGVMCIGLMAGCGSSNKNAQTDSTDPKDRTQLTVGFDAEFPPYGYKNGDDYEGFDLDLAQAVCDYYGWKLVKQPIDWDSKDMELSGGSIDCIWNGFTMNGREDDYTWSKPYIDNSQVVVVKKDSNITSIDGLSGVIMDVQADSSALAALQGDDATDVGKQIASSVGQLVQVSNYNTAFMDLESGAANAIAMDVGVANYQIANRGADKYTILDQKISSEQYAIGFKKGNDTLRDQVQTALDALQKDGTLDKIVKEWSEKDDGAYSFLSETWCLNKQ